MVALELTSYLTLIDTMEISGESGHYLYKHRSMVKLFLYGLIKGISGFKTLHRQLKEKAEILSLVGLSAVPHRTTLSRRFKAMPELLRQLMLELHDQFVEKHKIQLSVMSTDSSLMHANGNLWHSKDMKAGRLPSCGNIDTEAHWGISGQGEWIFGYRLHCLVNANTEAPLPRDIRIHPANVKDSQVLKRETSSSLSDETELLLGDGGYDEQACYEVCDEREISLIAPIKVKDHSPEERRERAKLYQDPEVRAVFALRKSTVEPFQGRLKDLFDLEYLPIKGLANVRALVTLAATAYLLLAWFNVCLGRDLLCLKSTMLAIR